MKRFIIVASILVVTFTLFSACVPPAEPPETVVVRETVIVEGTPEVVERVVTATPDPAEEEEVVVEDTSKFGGTLVVQVDGMIQFDFAQCADDNSWYVISNVYSTLYRINRDRSIFPDLATSWEYVDDTTLILHLREGVTWQDGNDVFPEGESRKVVADDVVYSINYGVETEGSTLSAGFLDAFGSVEALDDYTVQVNMSIADALLMSGSRGLGHIAIIPHEAVDHYGDDFGLNPVGSGPFEFVEYSPDEHVILQRNEDYWMEPYLDQVIFKVIPDQDAALIAFEAGEVDYLGDVPKDDVERLQDDTRFILQTSGLECAPWVMYNLAVPYFQDQEFRQALAYAVDNEGISRNIEGNLYAGGCGVAGKGVPGYDPNLCKYFPYDPEGAAELLAGLGWEDSDGDGVLDKDGEPMAFELEIWNMGTMPRYGEAIAMQWKEIGIGVELQTVEFGTWIDDMLGGGEKAFGASGFCTDGGLNGVFGRSAATSTALNYDMPDVHDALDLANITIDPGERENILREAQETMFSQYYALPMQHSTGYTASRSWVHDWTGISWTANLCTENNNVWVSK